MWRGWVRTEQASAYADYIVRTGLSGYKGTPGNLGAQMWTADLAVTTTEGWSPVCPAARVGGQNRLNAHTYS
jgi:hypothetical protein